MLGFWSGEVCPHAASALSPSRANELLVTATARVKPERKSAVPSRSSKAHLPNEEGAQRSACQLRRVLEGAPLHRHASRVLDEQRAAAAQRPVAAWKER